MIGLLTKKVSERGLRSKLKTSRKTRKTRVRALTKEMKLIKMSTLSKKMRNSKWSVRVKTMPNQLTKK